MQFLLYEIFYLIIIIIKIIVTLEFIGYKK